MVTKRTIVLMTVILLCAPMAVQAQDTFGTGANEFTIDFVTISGSANQAGGVSLGFGFTFMDVDSDYRMGTYEITNDQWTKFRSAHGPVTGSPSDAYDQGPTYTGASVPANGVSWYEAAQFVNWLNVSTGNQPAYKFTGTRGASDYTLATWSIAEADNGTNLYRHKDALYFLPTEDEWVKAGYWNGSYFQTYATKPGESIHQGDGTNGTGWNYYIGGYATDPSGLWDVGSGSEELNGTFDMMGNVYEWLESAAEDTSYGVSSRRVLRGGPYTFLGSRLLASSYRNDAHPYYEDVTVGFRVASKVPEPATMAMLALGGVGMLHRRKK